MKNIKNIIISLGCLLIAGLLTLFILNWDQHALKIANLGVFFLKLSPFAFALAAICYFPFEQFNTPLKLLIVLAPFAVFFCYGVAKLIYFFGERVPYQDFYLLLQLLTPMFIIALALALRCGGMKAKDVAVFGAIAIVFMLSGIEDLSSQWLRLALDPAYKIPATWDWANHMIVRVGRPLTTNEAYVFIGIHFVIIALILYFAYAKNNLYTWFKKNYLTNSK